MSKYIKRDDAIEEVIRYFDLDRSSVELVLQQLPSIDIVRCKDCKYYHPSDNVEDITCEFGRRVGDYDYCSYGERKENENEGSI